MSGENFPTGAVVSYRYLIPDAPDFSDKEITEEEYEMYRGTKKGGSSGGSATLGGGKFSITTYQLWENQQVIWVIDLPSESGKGTSRRYYSSKGAGSGKGGKIIITS